MRHLLPSFRKVLIHMAHTRKISLILTLFAVALTWLLIPGIRTGALLLRAIGGQLGAELYLPARMLQPASTIVMVVLASLGTLFLLFVQIRKLPEEMRLSLLCGYFCLLAIYMYLVLIVLVLQVGSLLFPISPTIAPSP